LKNLTQGTEHAYEPLDESLLEIIAVGGWRPMVRNRLAGLRAG